MSYPQTPHGGTELDLVEQAQRGDVDAFAKLVKRHAPDLFRLAAAIVGPDDAADATHDALLQAWQGLAKLRKLEAFEAWLRTILVNRCRNLLRERRRTVRAIRVDLVVSDDFRPSVERSAILERAFDRLTPEQKTVLALHYVTDLPIAQVASTIGVPVGTAKSRLAAGLARLREAIRENR